MFCRFAFCSDNGGLPEIKPGTVGDLRGFKGSVFEGGLRVPGIVEWPAVIKTPRITRYPAGTFDIFPTIAEIAGLPDTVMLKPVDGLSLRPLFTTEQKERPKPLVFRHTGRAALIDNRYKILTLSLEKGSFEIYDLETDPRETKDLAAEKPELAARLRTALLRWNESVQASVAGKDYPEGRVSSKEPPSRDWMTAPEYAPYLQELQARPEYRPKAAGKKKG